MGNSELSSYYQAFLDLYGETSPYGYGYGYPYRDAWEEYQVYRVVGVEMEPGSSYKTLILEAVRNPLSKG